ncbi:MAG TPA: ribose 5-phosphate isomerase B [Flavobacteriaceae bacterium]|nr:ribose 5-phosphate isomerase B [Flavobacteriaceae bacterium]
MKIVIGNDHAGTEYKKSIVELLETMGHQVHNYGTDNNNSVDYPDHVHPVAKDVDQNNADFGVLICGSGNGVCMTANKYQNVRAALCWNTEIAGLARGHNNANIICIPARYVSLDQALNMIQTFFTEPFEGGRHQNRVDKIPCS